MFDLNLFFDFQTGAQFVSHPKYRCQVQYFPCPFFGSVAILMLIASPTELKQSAIFFFVMDPESPWMRRVSDSPPLRIGKQYIIPYPIIFYQLPTFHPAQHSVQLYISEEIHCYKQCYEPIHKLDRSSYIILFFGIILKQPNHHQNYHQQQLFKQKYTEICINKIKYFKNTAINKRQNLAKQVFTQQFQLVILNTQMKKLEIKLEAQTNIVKPPKTFTELKSIVMTAFPILNDFRWDFCYIDQDGDKIAVDQQYEYLELINLLNQMNTNLECIIIKKSSIKQNVNSQIPQQNLQHSNIFSEAAEQPQSQGNNDRLSSDSYLESYEASNSLNVISPQGQKKAETSLMKFELSGQIIQNGKVVDPSSDGVKRGNQTNQMEQHRDPLSSLLEKDNSQIHSADVQQDDQNKQIKLQVEYQQQAQSIRSDDLTEIQIEDDDPHQSPQIINNQPARQEQYQLGQFNEYRGQQAQQQPYFNQSNIVQQSHRQNNLQEGNQQGQITISKFLYNTLIQKSKKLQMVENQLRRTRSTSRNASNNTQKCLFCNGINNIDRPYYMFSNITMCYSCDTKIDIKLKKRHFRPAQHQGQH